MPKSYNSSVQQFMLFLSIVTLYFVFCNCVEIGTEEENFGGLEEIASPRRRGPIWRNTFNRPCNRHLSYDFDRFDDKNLQNGKQNTEDFSSRRNGRRMPKKLKNSTSENKHQKIQSSGLTLLECETKTEDQRLILDEHNLLRTLIAQGLLPNQPKGINLKKMVWDAKLATEAETVARTGSYGNILVNDTRFLVGQNTYQQVATEPEKSDWIKAITTWFDEYNNYTFGPTTLSNKAPHYTQIVWAETYMLGCARCHFSKDNSTQLFHTYVCNYGPAGNNIEEAPYVKGTEGCPFLC